MASIFPFKLFIVGWTAIQQHVANGAGRIEAIWRPGSIMTKTPFGLSLSKAMAAAAKHDEMSGRSEAVYTNKARSKEPSPTVDDSANEGVRLLLKVIRGGGGGEVESSVACPLVISSMSFLEHSRIVWDGSIP